MFRFYIYNNWIWSVFNCYINYLKLTSLGSKGFGPMIAFFSLGTLTFTSTLFVVHCRHCTALYSVHSTHIMCLCTEKVDIVVKRFYKCVMNTYTHIHTHTVLSITLNIHDFLWVCTEKHFRYLVANSELASCRPCYIYTLNETKCHRKCCTRTEQALSIYLIYNFLQVDLSIRILEVNVRAPDGCTFANDFLSGQRQCGDAK